MRLSTLIESFEFVRKEFFSKWDSQNNWVVKIDKKLPCQGLCERKIKTIKVRNIPYIQNSLFSLLIHEMCHAVSTDSHKGGRWENRMLKAAELARKKGNSQLSKMIVYDVKKFRKVGEEGKAGSLAGGNEPAGPGSRKKT